MAGAGNGNQPVRDRAKPGPEPRRTAVDPFDCQQSEADAGAADVDDGVDAADLVEVDVAGRRAVDLCLGLGEPREDRDAPRSWTGSSRAEASEQVADRRPVAAGASAGAVDVTRVPPIPCWLAAPP